MPAKYSTIDEYLATLKPDQRLALAKLRKAIQSAAPQAEEGISYGLPAFRLHGRPLAAMSASTNHCSFFPMDGSTVAKFKTQLSGFSTSKGTIRFQPDRPLPSALVKRIVQARIADISQRANVSKKTGAPKAKIDPAVKKFLDDAKHPLRKEYQLVRKIMLGVDPAIADGIKWNSLSFRTTEWFATINWRSKDAVQLVFHLGAKVKDNSTKGMTIPDSAKLIKWVAKDRCLVTLGKGKDLEKDRRALEKIVKAWIRYV